MCLTHVELRTLDYKTWSLVRYKLTLVEAVKIVYANVRASLMRKRPADYMSDELEDLLCGYIPERHEIVRPFVDYVELDV